MVTEKSYSIYDVYNALHDVWTGLPYYENHWLHTEWNQPRDTKLVKTGDTNVL